MPIHVGQQIESHDESTLDRHDPLARYLLIIITAGIVLTVAALELWFFTS